MKWSVIRQGLSEKPTSIRDEFIIRAFERGHYLPIKWAAVSSEVDGYLGVMYVARDAVQLGEEGDSCRVNVTAFSAQRIVDVLGLSLLTDKIADLVHDQAAIVASPMVDGDAMQNGRGAHLSTMEKHSRRVELAAGPIDGLASTVGKHWILHDKLENKKRRGVNYGWHTKKAPYKGRGGHKMWQPIGTKHSWSHVDYSQVLVPMNRIMLVDGEEMLVDEVMQHPTLSVLVSYDGPMSVTRHPDVQTPEGGVRIFRI